MSAGFDPGACFAPRPIAFGGVTHHRSYRVKRYSIVAPGQTLDPARFREGEALALGVLPVPACTAERPGLALLIAHQGASADYMVLGWWDRRNELPIRVWVRAPGREAHRWTPARDSESVCVWDLSVVWFERQAFVAAMLAPTGPDPDGYLRAVCTSTA